MLQTNIVKLLNIFQEREKEAHEAAASGPAKSANTDECTIRTNPPLNRGASGDASLGGMNGGPSGGSISDGCETCSQHKPNSMSREALHKVGEGKEWLFVTPFLVSIFLTDLLCQLFLYSN